jgi:DNA sulfur modification protein DndC
MKKLTREGLQNLLSEIRDTYVNNPHPWVIGYSGGKDSTCSLQLVWSALAELPLEQRTKPVYVISTDTLVETPVIVNHVTDTMAAINSQALVQQLPFSAHVLKPQVQDTFWVNLIGKGYPAPTSVFRWCTDRLKIKPSNRFILDKVAESGEVILVLGVRRGESATRDQVINMHRVPGKQLARHGQLPGAWVFMPIEEFTVDDVWSFLLQRPDNPWGGDNRQLAHLYQSAQDGECPLVVDTQTSSCGNSRFGCWTCTVVAADRSMQSVIENGETWLTPLLDFRDFLAETQNPESKPETREFRGRNGSIKLSKTGNILYRTYKLEFSRTILQRLLETQVQVQQHDPELVLISEAELREIRRLWIMERHDWEDSLPAIHARVTGQTLYWERDDVATPGRMEAALLDEAADEENLPVALLRKLVDVEWQHHGMRRRSSIHKAVESIMHQDWRTMTQLEADIARQYPQPNAVLEGDTIQENLATNQNED